MSLLDRPTTTLRLRTKRNGTAASCNFDDKFPPAYVRLEVDANNNANVRFVIHELIHVVISELILGKFDATLEEVLVVAFENYIWSFVERSPARLKKWEKLLAKKLAEAPAEPDAPFEEMVDRRGEN